MAGFELQEAPARASDSPAGPISPDESWSPLESWIWQKLQAGQLANIDNYEDKGSRLSPADPGKPEDWQDGRRRLAPRFLEDLLLREPYRSGLHRKGVRIEGAWFADEIDLSMAELSRPLWLDRCRFEKSADLKYLRTPAPVSLDGSCFAAHVDLQGAWIDANLFMSNGTEFNDVILSGAKVGGQVALIGAKVAGTLAMESADIGQNLYMRSDRRVSEQQAEFNTAILNGAKIGGQVDLTGAKVAGTLAMDSIGIGQSLLMASNRKVSQQQAEFNDVVLRGARVGGQVALMGAKVAGTLAMDSIEIGRSLLMASDHGVSEQQAEFNIVVLNGAKVGGQVVLNGAKVARVLDMDSADIGQSLYISTDRASPKRQAEFNDVVLRGAKVGGQVVLTGANVAGTLNMDSIEIGQSLLMASDQNVLEQRTELNEVVLRNAKISGQVALTGAKIAGTLNMSAADIGQSVLMASNHKVSEQRTELSEVILRGAKVGGLVDLSGAKIAGTIDMDSADIGQHLFMRSVSEQRAEFDGRVSLIFAEIGRNLDVSGAVLSSLDLTGTRIGGELRLASPSWSPQWKSRGSLILRNASAHAIQDTDERRAWPPVLDLDGFTYRQLGGLGAAAEAGIAKRGSRWFIDWLAKDEPHTPQPYQQCAQVLREMGHPEMANAVLYAGRERERKQAWRSGNKLRATGLLLLNGFVGYGYGQRLLWHPLAWLVALVVAGTAVLHFGGVPGALAHTGPAVAYSLDTLLPIVELEKSFEQIVLQGFVKYYFYFQKLMGWVLASFLIAGLSGITK